SARAMAPPMPPDAPVTSAALPERSNIASPQIPSSRAKPPEGRRSRGTSSCRCALKIRSLHYASLRSAPVGMTEGLRRLQESFDVGRRVERQAGHVLVDASRQARQHLAGTAFDQRLDALGLYILH